MQRWANLALEEFQLIAEGCGLDGDPGETGEQSDEGPLEEDRPQTGNSQTGNSKSQSVKSLMAGSHRGGIPWGLD
jgi:hypothetical protein